MIKKILVKNVATYNYEGQSIEPKKVNFLFGLNGSGKTTISRCIASPTDEKYRECEISWADSRIKCSVYNRDFVRENFSETVPGIFTLGESTIETQNQIKRLTEEISELSETIDKKTKEKDGCDDNAGYIQQLKSHEETYADKFWKIKQKLDQEESPILNALEGVRASKVKFKDKLLSENRVNNSELLSREELERLTAQLFGASADKVELIATPYFDDLLSLENEDILKTVIVGKEDVTIANLIKKLGNSSWFSQGRQYLGLSDGKCPFCQQKLPDNFSQQIEDYFDKTYEADMQKVSDLKNKYGSFAERLVSQLQTLIDTPNDFLNQDSLEKEIALLKVKLQANRTEIGKKISAPNCIIVLDSIKQITENIERLICQANTAIKEHNSRIENIKEERGKLTSQVWKYILMQLSAEIKEYSERETEIENSIKDAKDTISEATNERTIKIRDLRSLEEKLTSIIPTANGINAILENYGFTNFKLDVDDKNKTYQFVRANGEPAFESLSEGEKNFVTFLYFMQMLKGNTDGTGHNENKVLVIDDPVSSLDNDVLFLVSTLIRDLFQNVYRDRGTIKQIFVLSHNLYFFKEVSYDNNNNLLVKGQTGYWMITKANNTSKIIEYGKNPISSTYEMLWDEVIRANKNPMNCNAVTLANTMRRILEYYFSFLGGKNLNKFHFQFLDGDRQVFKSLISWVNSGSHSAFDDFSATTAIYSGEKYLSVFRKLFETTDHLSHYNMMMKIETEEESHE